MIIDSYFSALAELGKNKKYTGLEANIILKLYKLIAYSSGVVFCLRVSICYHLLEVCFVDIRLD